MTGKKKSIDQWKKMKNNFWIPGKRKTSIEHWREENKPALKLIWNMAQILRELKGENDHRMIKGHPRLLRETFFHIIIIIFTQLVSWISIKNEDWQGSLALTKFTKY